MKQKEEYETYVIKDRNTLDIVLAYEKKQYLEYMYPSKKKYILGILKNEPTIKIMRWQRISRITDYHDFQYHQTGSVWHLFMYLFYIRKRNKWSNRIGLEMTTEHIGKGLMIYHYNNVINAHAIIGENCHIHGTCVIGNGGADNPNCPSIGDNVMLGAGAKVIGDITIADGIKIAAGAVVVHPFTEPNITLVGIPARKVIKNRYEAT